MEMDYYKVLGCSRGATQAEIKRAYHARLLQSHPDKNNAEDAREFHKIKEAWRVLGHEQSRKNYDAACRQQELEKDAGDDLVYERLSSDKLIKSIFDTLFFRCRCGDYYFVEPKDLHENLPLRVTCNGCTLIIIVDT